VTLSIVGDGKDALRIRFPFCETLVEAMRTIPGRKWEPEKKEWIIPDTQYHCDRLLIALYRTGLFNISKSIASEKLAEPHINAFLTHLAVEQNLSASSQNQALSALLFLYRHVLSINLGNLSSLIRANKPTRLPVVMTREEVKKLLSTLTGEKKTHCFSSVWYRDEAHGVSTTTCAGH